MVADHASTDTDAEDSSQKGVISEDGDQAEYPSGRALAAIVLALYLAVFLVALVSIKPIHPFPVHVLPKPFYHIPADGDEMLQ